MRSGLGYKTNFNFNCDSLSSRNLPTSNSCLVLVYNEPVLNIGLQRKQLRYMRKIRCQKRYLAALADSIYGDYHGLETTTVILQSMVTQSLS